MYVILSSHTKTHIHDFKTTPSNQTTTIITHKKTITALHTTIFMTQAFLTNYGVKRDTKHHTPHPPSNKFLTGRTSPQPAKPQLFIMKTTLTAHTPPSPSLQKTFQKFACGIILRGLGHQAHPSPRLPILVSKPGCTVSVCQHKYTPLPKNAKKCKASKQRSKRRQRIRL